MYRGVNFTEFLRRYTPYRKVRQKKKPRFYKVMLHNDSVNRREYVVRVLLKVVKGLTVEDAVNVMQHVQCCP